MQLTLSVVISLMLLLIGLVLTYVVHKVRRIHSLAYTLREETRIDVENSFQQLSILAGLYIDLGLRKGLPATRGYAASPDFLRELVDHALESQPRVVLECSSGVSTIVLARCLELNGSGHIYSLEHLTEYANETRRNLAKHGLTEWATVLDASLCNHTIGEEHWSWYSEEALPDLAIDMLVVDGPPQSTGPLARYPAGPILFKLLARDAVVFADDSSRPDEKAMLERWTKEFPELRREQRYCEKGCVVLWKTAENEQRETSSTDDD
jgi:predicted O-methyltransferase YrrM